MTQYCTKVLNVNSEKGHTFPPETTHCSLSLLPKPGKTSRRPCDLRPLGLQDPSSKVLANALKARVLAEAGEFLGTKPQFAYCPGKAIDGAISRVAQHCARIRHRIRRGALSVHERRQGHKESTCFGGLMISLDLSRAFDDVPRQSLAQALTNAGILDSLQHAILSMHEDCQYEVKHEAHTASFPMLKGVRQGCSLAPLLFAIYSCWIYDKIEIRTPAGWAETLLTLFADDSHLAFEIESMADLEQAQRTIRTVFQVFKTTGMRINPSKSKLVLGLRGSAARRWLRKHTCLLEGKPAISLGVPSEPLLIPRVHSMVYLGVVTSYQRFELQTAEHRFAAAIRNKQRLALQKLPMRLRVRLYIACVRSTLLYGIHAVGAPVEVLRRLDAFDARSLRSIVRSHAHMTYENTAALRRRIGVTSPCEALLALLKSRTQRSSEDASQQWFSKLRTDIVESQASSPPASAGTDCSAQAWGVPCDVCGQYFAQSAQTQAPGLHLTYPASTLTDPGCSPCRQIFARDGMPTCRLGGESFTRVEGLKKHIHRGCPHQANTPVQLSTDRVATTSVVEVATEGGEVVVQQGPTSQATPAHLQEPPLMQNPAFLPLLRTAWRNVLQNSAYCQNLSTYCVFCRQWISLIGPGCKQHHRLMHADEYRLASNATARTASLGLVPEAPCRYCHKLSKDPRKHLQACVPVYQASLAALVLNQRDCEEQDGRGRRGDAGLLCAGGAGLGVWKGQAGELRRGGGSPIKDSLQQMVQDWHDQYAVHGLWSSPTLPAIV